ncbi:hypothetical protein APR04_003845 [Promicromonospora umidemergens]|nr:hypothetical protein [Promicromonospora umidemergens]
MLPPEALVENAFAQAVQASRSLAESLDAYQHLRDWADTDYRDYVEASENAVRDLRLVEDWEATGAPRWGDVVAHLALADSRLHTVAELRTPIIQQWDKVRDHLASYRPVLDASSVVGGRRGMYAWLAFQATLAAHPAEVTAMTPAQRIERFHAMADELIERMDAAWSEDREAYDQWNFDSGSDPDNVPVLRTEWAVEADVLLAELPNEFLDSSLPVSALDQYLIARDLADCARNLPSGSDMTQGVSIERSMIGAMLRLVADRPDQNVPDGHQHLQDELNELAVDLDRYQWHAGRTPASRGVVVNLITTTEHIRDIVDEQNHRRITSAPFPHRDRFRIAPQRLSHDSPGPGC